MDLYLIRHGDALPLGELGISEDAKRPLTERGKQQAHMVVSGLQRRGIRPLLMLSSPLLRARQTAEEVLKHWPAPVPELVICDELAPGCKRQKLGRFLQERPEDRVALVGHQPDLGEFVAWLIGGKKGDVDFAKGGVAHVHCNAQPRKGEGTLLWLVTPDWLADGLEARFSS